MLGTLVEIGAAGANAVAGIEAAFHEIETIHRLMSFHEANSDVSRINCAVPGEMVRLDWRTFEVIACAQAMSRFSAGAFDITVGGRLVEAGFLPPPHRAPEYDRDATFEDLRLLPPHSATLTPRVWIDLGGIAKGYAVDRAVQVLRESGVTSGIVNAGGDLYVLREPQAIHIRHPEKASLVLPLGPFATAAVASSSGIFTARGHSDALVDVRRGACVKWRQGITVIAARCMIADALTKVVRLAPRRAPGILAQYYAQALLIDRRGMRVSVQLKSRNDAVYGGAFKSSIRPELRCRSALVREIL